MNSASSTPPEMTHRDAPLSKAARFTLIVGAASVILGCYLFALLAMTALLLVLAVEGALMLALLRFGLAGYMLSRMQRHFPLLRIFGRSLFLGKSESARFQIVKTDAPELFTIIEDVSRRIGVPVPREVCVEMSSGAWVQLHGWRSGSSNTVLGLGYDLLAVLDETEIAAVLAHEMAHAKLVKRGLKQWLNGGLNRSIVLTRGFSAEVQRYRQNEKALWLGEQFLSVSHRMTLWGVRLVSAYSRQDEFDADRGAAALYGVGPLRSSLTRLQAIASQLDRVPWNERVFRLQGEGSFSTWLMNETALTQTTPASASEIHEVDEYSTHPSLRDRIAALPQVDVPVVEGQCCGLEFFTDADAVARNLMREIQRMQALQEEKDGRELDRWLRRSRRSSNIRPLQWPGILVLLVGVVFLFVAFFVGVLGRDVNGLWSLLFGSLLMWAGVWLFRLGRHRDKIKLPIPAYAMIAQFWREERTAEALKAQEEELVTALNKLADGEHKKRAKIRRLLGESHTALERGDFLRAFTAARLALAHDNKHVDVAVAFAVSSGALGVEESLTSSLTFLHERTAFASPSTQWGAGWALAMNGNWDQAEAFFRQVLATLPDQPTITAMQALTQWRRGKLQLAIQNARKACAAAPGEVEQSRLLISILIDAGHLRDASELLAKLPESAHADPEFLLKRVRLALLQGKFEEAGVLLGGLRAHENAERFLVRLGEAYEAARKDDVADTLYRDALAAGHNPQALLGLSRIEAARHNKEAARAHILAALDAERPLGKNAANCFAFFTPLLGQLVMMEEPQRNLRAWIAKFDGSFLPAAISGHSLMVFGSSEADAKQRLGTLVDAMYPGKEFFKASKYTLRDAHADQQPVGLARPGVQYAVN